MLLKREKGEQSIRFVDVESPVESVEWKETQKDLKNCVLCFTMKREIKCDEAKCVCRSLQTNTIDRTRCCVDFFSYRGSGITLNCKEIKKTARKRHTTLSDERITNNRSSMMLWIFAFNISNHKRPLHHSMTRWFLILFWRTEWTFTLTGQFYFTFYCHSRQRRRRRTQRTRRMHERRVVKFALFECWWGWSCSFVCY